ncbi:Putative lipoprotein YerB precursor [Streptomyces sp. Go-475]|nr:Putative lipoprotein YerB precursor [Streptomyces sp. Go-475]
MATVGMGRGARGRRAATTAALLAATVTATLAAGCTNGGGTTDDGRGSARESRQETSPSAPGRSVLAVKIDNARAARPHTGVDAADVVYVEQVEGGLSRLMAVYATKVPKTVGPVRSARESDLELLRQFDRPTLAFSGAQKKLLPLIDRAPLRAETPGSTPDAFFRDSGRPAPYNLFLRPERLVPETPGQSALTTGFRYGSAPAGGTATASQTVRYPAARFTFTWSDARDRWLVGMDGAPATTADGKRMAAATIVVQYVTVRESAFRDFLGNNTPYTETVGSGKAKVLRDGRAYDVNWKRAEAADGTAFTTGDGTPVNFAKGQVWVVYAKAS